MERKNQAKYIKQKLPIGKSFTYLFLIFWTVIQLFPLYWMFTFSLKSNKEIFGENTLGLPKQWLWSNYQKALNQGNMGRYFINSVIVTGLTILFTTVFAIMASYALKRLVWKGRKVVNQLFMLGLTIPIHASLLPVFLILTSLKMTNSYQALVLPYTAFALAMAILICNGFMENIPVELEEAACIDGCNVFKMFFRIIFPLMKPALSTISIFTFLQAWNELMFAVTFISKSEFRTLSVGIQTLSGAFTTEWGPIGAALVIATIPTLLMYCFMSRRIQSSLIAGAVKG
ncbi:putative ABC transporter permease protein YurM [Clostridia bacterium]|nr:putative ABC transporter permease protein YurM [Clostridia bacterium]